MFLLCIIMALTTGNVRILQTKVLLIPMLFLVHVFSMNLSTAFSQDVTIAVNSSLDNSVIGLAYDGVLVYEEYGVFTWQLRQPVGIIAVYTHGALLAKTTDDFVTSSDKWRCTTSPDGAWHALWYDDSDWPVAVEVNLPVAGVMQPARWITASESNPQDWTCCRGYYGNISRINLTAHVTDGAIEVYYDGTWQARQENTLQIPLPSHVTIIGMETSQPAAVFLLNTSDGFLTNDDAWSCSAKFTAGWTEVNFTETMDWSAAVVVTMTQSPGSADVDAQWITSQQKGQPDGHIYCRGYYGDFQRTTVNPSSLDSRTQQISYTNTNDDSWSATLYTTHSNIRIEESGETSGNIGLLVGISVGIAILGVCIMIIISIVLRRYKRIGKEGRQHSGGAGDINENGQQQIDTGSTIANGGYDYIDDENMDSTDTRQDSSRTQNGLYLSPIDSSAYYESMTSSDGDGYEEPLNEHV